MTMHPAVPDDVIPPLQRLQQARDDVAERDRVLERLDRESRALDVALQQLDEAHDALAAESRDVERLEGASARRLWSSLRGTRDADLGRERGEVDTAAAAVEHAEREVDRQGAVVDALSARAAALADADTDLEVALEIVARGIDGLETSAPHAVAAAANELSVRRELREIEQALVAGRAAHESLREAHSVIADADSWSGWDTFGGGGMFSSMMKHERLDEARGRLESAAEALADFTRELDDLHLPGIQLGDFDGLTRGIDIWFDNIFTDLAVRSEIKRCRRDVGAALDAVTSALDGLEARQQALTG
jgi:hypothetical protein